MPVAEHYDEIPHHSRVVFDWDNTLKIINRQKKTIECSVSSKFLQDLVSKKACTLYIISAVRPSRINMETILMEVRKLGIQEFFCPEWQSEHQPRPQCLEDKLQLTPSTIQPGQACAHSLKVQQVQGQPHSYVRWGNIVICGYDKAEVFLELVAEETFKHVTSAEQSLSESVKSGHAAITYENKEKAPSSKYIFEAEVEDVVDGLSRFCTSEERHRTDVSSRSTSQHDVVEDVVEGLDIMLHTNNEQLPGKTSTDLQKEGKLTLRNFEAESESDIVVDGLSTGSGAPKGCSAPLVPNPHGHRPVVFFDDEEVNILNFGEIVENSRCFWIQHQ